MELADVPDHLLVLGGGYVGLEFGQLFRRLGSRVTIVQSARRLLNREDPDIADAVATILTEDGIDVLLNTTAVAVSARGGSVELTVRVDEQESRVVSGSQLLVATGRAPDTDTLNLPAAGISTSDRGFITVNGRLETNVPGVFALGDVKGGPAFTHIAYDDFRILRTNLIEKGNATIEGRLVPYTVFIDPQLGRVGLSEADARAQQTKVRVARMPMTKVARAIETDESRGFMKAIVDAGTGQILGAAVLGVEGGEVMTMLEIAMMGKLPYTALRDAVIAHPTLAESLNNLFTNFDS
jgi:pyruvate/2-oxoglutarate dehydrogenase complex dihydrolipoamide dehydrogenase (E3) component